MDSTTIPLGRITWADPFRGKSMFQLFWKYPRSLALPALAVAAMTFALVAADRASAASTFKILHAFKGSFQSHDGGYRPHGGVLVKRSNELYGTTYYGGSFSSAGVVFKLAYDSGTGKWKEYVLHRFGTDGVNPEGELIIDVDGNLYGTTYATYDDQDYYTGTDYKLTHGAKGWKETVVHFFCAIGCADGRAPGAGLVYAGQASGAPWNKTSPLFGTTLAGGTYDHGTVFKLVYDGTSWQETVIHNFNTSNGPNALVMDDAGNLFGMTQYGGKYGDGVMYKLAHDTWTETLLHNFCHACSTGGHPNGGLIMDGSGNLFGTAEDGGQYENGVVFERAANGTFSVLYNFCSVSAGGECQDGNHPRAGLIRDRLGNLFGTTFEGGTGHDSQGGTGGTVFKLAPNGDGTWTESVLHPFCNIAGCSDGAQPVAPLAFDSAGNLFGTTSGTQSSSENEGSVFRVQP
jgi:uncharacterized repeat protein (TIGR03803 family)